MLARVKFDQTKAYHQLQKHFQEVQRLHLRDLFKQDPTRFDQFSLRFQDILLDYSKNRITAETKALLIALSKECRLKAAIEYMLSFEAFSTMP